MGIVAWIVLGLVAGFLAKFLMHGKGPHGLILTALLGIGGALLGGFIGSHFFHWGAVDEFNFRSVLLAVGGAVLLLIVYGFLKKAKYI